MDSLFLTLPAAILFTLLCEGVLWLLFRKKIRHLAFPHELDTSYFRFFSIYKLRIVAVLHTVFATLCIVILLSYLW